MDAIFDGDYGALFAFLAVGIIVLNVFVVIAILKIPGIARLQKAQVKLLALQAAQLGCSGQHIDQVVKATNTGFAEDTDFYDQLNSVLDNRPVTWKQMVLDSQHTNSHKE